MVPVRFQANGAETVTTWDGHGVPEVFLTQVAVVLVRRHEENLGLFPLIQKDSAERQLVTCVSTVAK